MNLYYSDTILGRVGIGESDEQLTNLYFAPGDVPVAADICKTPLLTEAAAQLQAYLGGELHCFSLPLTPGGTPFMQRVWKALLDIPFGRTASYKEIAAAVGSPKAARAVGMANNSNPLPIFIPCHRVIGADGTLVGYAGGLAIKARLLEIEGHAPLLRTLRAPGCAERG
jgi:methylated-DNA-[protein]-cysteine S-methyltransferase